MLAFGADGLLTGDRRFDRLSFCPNEAEAPNRLSHPPFASLRLCAGGGVGGSAFFRMGGRGILASLASWRFKLGGWANPASDIEILYHAEASPRDWLTQQLEARHEQSP